MKSFRLKIINSTKKHHVQIQNARDFYSLSEFKDLLFNIKEHRLSIPQIKEYLSELELKFCGFETKNTIKFTNIYKDDTCNLDKWQIFEEANPTAFVDMYQFWCQKISKVNSW